MYKRNIKRTGKTTEISCSSLWSFFRSELWHFDITLQLQRHPLWWEQIFLGLGGFGTGSDIQLWGFLGFFFLSVQIHSYIYRYMHQFHSGSLGVYSVLADGPITAVERYLCLVQRPERCWWFCEGQNNNLLQPERIMETKKEKFF